MTKVYVIDRKDRPGYALRWDEDGQCKQRKANSTDRRGAELEAAILSYELDSPREFEYAHAHREAKRASEYQAIVEECESRLGKLLVAYRQVLKSANRLAIEHDMPEVPECSPIPIPAVAKLEGPIPAVYFLWSADAVVYVGETSDLTTRFKSHKQLEAGDRVSWIQFPKHQTKLAELYYIWLLRPIRNHEAAIYDQSYDQSYDHVPILGGAL